MYTSEIDKKFKKTFWVFEIIAFELVALNTHFYWQRILVTGVQYVKKKSQDFRYFQDRILGSEFFLNDQKIWQNYCRADFSIVSDPLTWSLSISILTGGFLDI